MPVSVSPGLVQFALVCRLTDWMFIPLSAIAFASHNGTTTGTTAQRR
jgi:hypothetical protein